jgi:hypothetical protein
MTEKRVCMSSSMGNMMIAGACMAKEDLEENYFSDQQGCSSDEGLLPCND